MVAIGCLSADHRDVVVGRYYLDWSEKQLAEALGVSSGTVKSRLHRALGRLGQLMEEDHG
jgi:RNA polymerase sigma-70 factor (ECF subfamily)